MTHQAGEGGHKCHYEKQSSPFADTTQRQGLLSSRNCSAMHTRDPSINAGNPNADNLAKIGVSEAFGPLTLDQLPHNLLPPEERYWKAQCDHGLITRPLERHGTCKPTPLPIWIRKRKHKLQVVLRLLRAQSNHINDDTNKCTLCSQHDPDLVHHFNCKFRSRQGKQRITTLWTAAIRSGNPPPGAWLLYPQQPWPPPCFRPCGYREFLDISHEKWFVQDQWE